MPDYNMSNPFKRTSIVVKRFLLDLDWTKEHNGDTAYFKNGFKANVLDDTISVWEPSRGMPILDNIKHTDIVVNPYYSFFCNPQTISNV